MSAGTATYAAGCNGTQLSNPRTAKGAPLRCPECQRYAHAPNTTCKRELRARVDAA